MEAERLEEDTLASLRSRLVFGGTQELLTVAATT